MEYKEKLRLAKEALNSGSYDKETIEYIFPELAESKDEGMRKALIEGFKVMKNGSYGECTFSNYNIPVTDIIAWLEKQEEPNPYSGVSFSYNGNIWGMCARDNGVDILLDRQLFKHLKKQGEQKLTDTDNKFIRMRETKPKDISEFLDRLTTVEQEFLWEHIAKIRELDKEEQKPAGWHREDEQNLNACLGYIPDEFLRRWLKDIIHAKYERPSWSEEDEEMIDETLYFIKEYQQSNRCKDENGMQNSVSCAHWLNKLKSLRPQSTWKPSDKQLETLEHFVRSIDESGYASSYDNTTKLLYSLLADLNKIREE